jgi:cell division protein FtsW (lipid II flippase)
MAMNALALFGASFSVPLFATFVRSEKARNELTIVASFAAIGMLVSVLALIDDSTGLTAWFGLTVPPVDFLN